MNTQKLPFDKKLFNLVRLDIMMNLDGEPPIPFSELKAVCELTDGNLSSHLRVLENLGFVSSYKSFVSRKPQTTYRITSRGKGQLEDLKDWLYQTFIEPG